RAVSGCCQRRPPAGILSPSQEPDSHGILYRAVAPTSFQYEKNSGIQIREPAGDACVKPGAIAEKRILIVEDDWLIAQALADSFPQAGARVVGPVRSVTSALDAMRGDLPHAAVLDVLLDGETTYPVADFLSEHGIPFVFATAFSSVVPLSYRGVK